MKIKISKNRISALLIVGIFAITSIWFTVPADASFPGTDYRVAYSKIAIGEGGMSASLATNSLQGDDEQVLVTSSEYGFMAPRFSADGQKITYSQLMFGGGVANVYVSDADGSNQVNVSNVDPEAYPERQNYQVMYSSLSSDGGRVVYGERWEGESNERHCHIFIVNSDGSNKSQLTNDVDYCDMHPVFSPDDQKIAFIRTTSEETEEETVGRNSIYVMDANGANPQEIYTYGGRDEKVQELMNIVMAMLTFDGGQASPIDWSPDGSRVLFSELIPTSETTYTTRVAKVDISGNDEDIIVHNGTIDPEAPVVPLYGQAQFTPEGKIIYKEIVLTEPESEENSRVEQYIRLADGDGSNITQLLYQDVPVMDGGMSMTIAAMNYGLPTVYSEAGSEPEGGPNAFLTNLENAKQIALSSNSCDTFTNTSAAKESAQSAQDTQYNYPSSLISFTLEGCTVGGSATVTLVFEGIDPSQSYVARKFNPVNGTFTTISGADISATTFGGQPATQLRYTIIDGGELDLDGEANGTIVDPVGLGLQVSGTNAGGLLASTGTGLLTAQVLAVLLVGGSAGYIFYRRRAARV